MDQKFIFLDIDGTLVSAMKAPSVLVTEAVRQARKNGHKVFLCTGRNMPIIGTDIRSVGFDGIIASAGGHVETDGKILFDNILPEETIQECLSVFHAHGIYCRIEDAEGIYTDPQMEELLRTAKPDKTNSELIRMQKEIEAGITIRSYDQYPGNGAYKICFTATSLDNIEKTKKYLGDRFNYAVHPYVNSSTCFNGEIILKGIDKGRGMALICQYYGADQKDTVAFGDSMNDYEMMETAKVSVAMGNACEELKSMADHVCGNVWDDGIYYGFQELGLI
ncbi:MAG: HAD family hydrolase [Lachnospiraceae bacterium]|nr:HAD family hydrolase [Lachnospiraceae bacterium]MDE6184607.1 HAD family hydrolase [Lachnospiraceae bacterium]MDE7287286.1 HAD family hydrolase [Lachnospiraceae bacterium]